MYQVEWARSAAAQLTEFWLEAESDERRRINSAVVQIEKMLSSSPLDQGESRSGDYRILLIPPLGAIYKVFEMDQRVKVLRVLKFRLKLG